MDNLGLAMIPTMANHLAETSSPRKKLLHASNVRVLEGCGFESKKSASALDNSPWGKPINVSPPASSKEIGFSKKESSGCVKNIKYFSTFFGMPCNKFEKEIMTLFSSIEASCNKDVLSKGSLDN